MRSLLLIGAIVSIIALVYVNSDYLEERQAAGTPISKTTTPSGCYVANLPYSEKKKSQVQELCEFGLSRDEAVRSLEAVYSTPGINPDAAVRIAKTGANIAAKTRDPWK